MRFDHDGQLVDFGLPPDELDAVIDGGVAFRTSGCPGKEAADVSACDRPYGDSPVRDIASYPFKLDRRDIRKVRSQLRRGLPK
jgi:biotin synthase